jgi:hypothetical protein
MFDFWFFVPKSGLVFIIFSVIGIFVWIKVQTYLIHPYDWIYGYEILLFIICFFIYSHGK